MGSKGFSGGRCGFYVVGFQPLPVMRLAPFLFVLVLAGCSRTPTDPEADTLYGEWEGDGRQWDDGDRDREPDGTWPVRIDVGTAVTGELTATIEYPSFPCSGRLEYLGPSMEPDARPGDAVFREVITRGADVCYSGGTVLLRAERGFLLYAWATDEAPAVASARLTRTD